MPLNDVQIVERCLGGMITPFIDHLVREVNGNKVISYGLSSCGYDIRLSPVDVKRSQLLEISLDREIDIESIDKIDRLGFITTRGHVNPKRIDPLVFDMCDTFHSRDGESVIVQPGQIILGHSIETFNMPPDIVGVAYGKSTYARSGLHVLVTPLEPGWAGQLVVEIANVSSNSVQLFLNEGIAQIQFHQIDRPKVTYADRGGKYQNQTGTTLSKV